MSLKIVLGDTKKVEIPCPRSQINRLNYVTVSRISVRLGWYTECDYNRDTVLLIVVVLVRLVLLLANVLHVNHRVPPLR